MKTKDIAKKSDKELEKAIASTREKIAAIKRDMYITDERNVRAAKHLRRDLARMLTAANQRANTDEPETTEEEKK